MTGTPSTPPAPQQPGGDGQTPGWGAVPPLTPPAPLQPTTGNGLPHRRTWLTHGATALVALVIGTMIGSGGGSTGTANSGQPVPAVTVTKSARAAAPEPAATVTVKATEKVTVKPKPTKKPGLPTTIGGDGQYLAGEDIKPGTYKTAGPEDDNFGLGCYWARLKNSSGEFSAIIANGNITGQSRVTVRKGEYFETKGCLKWKRVG